MENSTTIHDHAYRRTGTKAFRRRVQNGWHFPLYKLTPIVFSDPACTSVQIAHPTSGRMAKSTCYLFYKLQFLDLDVSKKHLLTTGVVLPHFWCTKNLGLWICTEHKTQVNVKEIRTPISTNHINQIITILYPASVSIAILNDAATSVIITNCYSTLSLFSTSLTIKTMIRMDEWMN